MKPFALALCVCAGLLAATAAAETPPPLRKLTLDDAIPDAHGIKRMALLRGLDKITGRATDIDAPAGVPVRFGTLSITVRYCYTRPPEETPETTAFLQIDEVLPGKEPNRLFSGWMFASTPALNALEHAVYDVWVITCKTNAPSREPPSAPAPATPAPKPAAPPAAATPAPAAVPPEQPDETPDEPAQPY